MISGRKPEPYSAVSIADDSVLNIDQPIHTQESFKPTWTRTLVLSSFILCFAAILAALQVLLWLSDRNNGLATATMSRYYLWTYGPTAILTVVLALWNRVDYRIRQMAPWLKMKGHLCMGDKNTFKDYLSPTTPEIFYHSIKNHDFIVTASVLITNLLVLTIVISTGLLNLTPRRVRHEGISYRTTSRLIGDGVYSDLYFDSHLPLDTLDAIDVLGLSYPPGTTAELNYQLTENVGQDLKAGDVQEVPVNVTMFDLVCEPAILVVHELYNTCSQCLDPDTCMSVPNIVQNISIYWRNVSSEQFIVIDNTDGMDIRYSGFVSEAGPAINDSCPQCFTLGILEYQQTGLAMNLSDKYCRNTTRSTGFADYSILNSSQWICSPHGSSAQATLLYNFTAGGTPEITVDRDTIKPLQSQVADLAINSVLWLQRTPNSPAEPNPPLRKELNATLTHGYNLLEGALPSSSNYTIGDFFNTDLLVSLTTAYYKRLIVQLVHNDMIIADNSTVIGAVIADEDRLVPQLTPLRLMQATTIIIICLTTYLAAVTHNKLIAPYDPTLIAGLMMILSRQPQIRSTLLGTGHLETDRLHTILSRNTVGLTSDTNSSNGQVSSLLDSAGASVRHQTRVKWYQPLTGGKMFKISMCVFVLLVVMCLQVLLYYSDQHNGIADVSVHGDFDTIWTLIPAALMVAVATYFRALDTIYKVFATFNGLRSVDSHRPLFVSYPAMTEFEVFVHAIRNGHMAIASMAVSVSLSALLTIVVSGVWTASLVSLPSEVILLQKSWFSDLNYQDNGVAGSNAYLSGLILSDNLSYPQWTYGSYAFGEYILSDESHDAPTSLRARLPAIRSSLNCTLHHQDELKDLSFGPAQAYFGPNSDDGAIDYYEISLTMPGSADCAYKWSAELAGYGNTSGWSDYFTNTVVGCPYINYVWGRQNVTLDPYNITYVQVLSCHETIQQEYIGVTMTVPGLDLDPNSLDVPPDDDFQIFSMANIDLPYEKLIWDKLPKSQAWSIEKGQTFYSIIDNVYGLTDTDYNEEDQIDNVVSAIKSVHPIIRAQQFNAALRTNSTVRNDSMLAPITAQLTTQGRHRLVQNTISTHILCGLLIAIVICTGVASLSMSIQYVLPKNPSSIAAMVSLLADSNIFDNAEVLNALENRLRGRGIGAGDAGLDGYRFFMGWFDGTDNGERRYTIGILDRDSNQDGRLGNEVDEGE